MSSVSAKGPRSVYQSSVAVQKSIADQGGYNSFSFKTINEKFLFPFYDEMLRMVKIHPFFSVVIVIIFIDQIFVSMSCFVEKNIANLFSNFNVSTSYEMISFPIIYVATNLVFFAYLFFNYRTKRIFNYWQLYLASIFLNFFNVIFFVPVCGVCGFSVYQLNNVINLHYKDTLQISPNDQPMFNYSMPTQSIYNRNLFFGKTSKLTKSSFPSKFESNFFEKKLKNNDARKNKKIIVLDEKDEPKPPDEPQDTPDYSGNVIDYTVETKHIALLLNHEFSKHSIILILFIIIAVILYFELLTNFHFMSESPYLNRTIFAMWDCQVFLSYLLLIGINQFFFYFLKILPGWCTSLYQLIILVVIIYIMYYTFFQPFIHIFTNTFIQSMLTSFFVSTFLSFILRFKFHYIILFIIMFSGLLFVIFLFVFQFINNKIIKNVHKKLSPPQIHPESADESIESSDSQFSSKFKKKNSMPKEHKSEVSSSTDSRPDQVELSENDKRELFDSYVFQSIEHALLYFRVGVSMASPYFIDFSFMRYMKEFYGQKQIQLFILQLSALFPPQHQFFNFCMTTFAKKVEFFNVYENFIMYQLHRINIIRQSSVSKEVQDELFRLEKMSDESISAIRGFWAELLQAKTAFNTSSLGFIRKMTLNTKSNYVDAIEKFPNSQQILNSYSRFLCEACGDYIECARIGQKMRLIEQGKNTNADHCFHSFVNVFPHYLKKRILNVYGHFISNSGSFSASQSSSSISSDRLSASFDNARGMPIDVNIKANFNFNYNSPLSIKKRYKDEFENLIEQEHFETLINSLFTNAKQRLSIQNIVDRSKNRALIFAKFVSFLQCLISIIVVIFTFTYISDSKNAIELMKSATRVSQISACFEYSSLVAGVQYTSEMYTINISAKMLDSLSIREENLPRYTCTFIHPITSFCIMKRTIVELFNEELKFLMANPDDHLKELKEYAVINNFQLTFSETASTKASTFIKNQTNIKKLLINKLNDNYTDDDYNYNDDSESGVNDSDYPEYGVYLYRFYLGFPFIVLTTLRNAINYIQSNVDRLSYEKTISLVQGFQNSFDLINLTKHQMMKKRKVLDFYDQYKFFDYYAELMSNSLSLSIPFSRLFRIISANAIDINKKFEIKIRISSEIILVVFFIIFLIARIINHIIIRQYSKVFSFAIQRVKGEEIAEAMKPIYLKSKKGIKIQSASSHSVFEYSPTLLIFSFVGFISIVVFIAFHAVAILIFIRSFNFIEHSFEWSSDSASRFLSITSLLNWLIIEKTNIFLDGFEVIYNLQDLYNDLQIITRKIDLSIIGRSKQLDNFYFMINEHESIEIELNNTNSTNSTKTNANYPSHLNNKKRSKLNDNSFDQFQKQLSYSTTKCSEFDNSKESTSMNFATYLDCISIENKINLAIHYYHLLQNVIHDFDIYELVDKTEFNALLFTVDKHLFRAMPDLQDKILEVTEAELKKQKNNVYLIGTFGLIFAIIFFIIELILIRNISFSYEAFKQLIMVLPPSAFYNNQFLINFLINTCSSSKLFIKISNNSIINTISRIGHHDEGFLSEEETLVALTDHAVINTCKNFIIQSVNPAVQKMTGIPSDQLLGQGLIYLIPLFSKNSKYKVHSIERSPFYQRLEEIKSNSGDRVAEVNTFCLTDKGDELLVQATIIGIFDKKNNLIKKANNSNQNKKLQFNKIHSNEDDDDFDTDTNSTAPTSATSSTTNIKNTLSFLTHSNVKNNDDNDEEFVGATIILKDISDEIMQKREVKETKRRNEALISFLIPQPVLEQIRTSRKSQFYNADMATIVKIEFCGLEEYIGSIMPKQIMTCLQTLYSRICSIGNNERKILYTGKKPTNKNKTDNILDHFNSTNDEPNFQFNFDNLQSEFSPRKNSDNVNNNNIDGNTNRIDFSQMNKSKINDDDDVDEDEINDDDDDCDFKCVYNIRNDIDNFVSISGLFDTKDDIKKQAESCVRYALKVRQIIENISLEEQFNLFIHAKIVVCMGPINGIVDDPDIPNFEVFSDLFVEADQMKKTGDLDTVYIDENVYNNVIKDNYEIEEKLLNLYDNDINISIEKNENQKIFVVNRCLIRKKNANNVFLINE